MIHPKVVDAVEALAETIINDKCDNNLFPQSATLSEIKNEFNNQLLDAMRQLCLSRGFQGSKTVNGVPVVSFKQQ